MRVGEPAEEDVVGVDHIASRAEPPLPEEAAAEQGGEDRYSAAAEVLRDSEERVTAAAEAGAPGDAARENRTSEDTAPS
jgi:hypothetical protein